MSDKRLIEKKTPQKVEYKPIQSMNGNGYITLNIWPPNSRTNNKNYMVFVGGCGVGEAKTLKEAEETLLREAKSFLQTTLSRLRQQTFHYQLELHRLGEIEKLPRKKEK